METNKSSIIRVGLIVYPFYIEPCALRARTVDAIVCKDPGLSIKILKTLQYALRYRFIFSVVPIIRNHSKGVLDQYLEEFKEDRIDMSGDIWEYTAERTDKLDYSIMPIFHRPSSFMTSSSALISYPSSLEIFHMTWQVMVLFLLAAVLIILMVTEIWKRKKRSISQLFFTLICDDWEYLYSSWSQRFCLAGWILATTVLIHSYNALVKTELMPVVAKPFTGTESLARAVMNGEFKIAVIDSGDAFLNMARSTEVPRYSILNESLTINPPISFENTEALRAAIRADARLVYPGNPITLKKLMHKTCAFGQTVNEDEEIGGLFYIFPKKSMLTNQLTGAILSIHSIVDKLTAEDLRESGCGAPTAVENPIGITNVAHIFKYFSYGLVVSALFCLAEIRHKIVNSAKKTGRTVKRTVKSCCRLKYCETC